MSINSVVNDLVTSVSVVNALKPLPPTISGYSVAGKDDLALDPAGGQTVQINGTGFLPGATITFDGSVVSVVTYVNPNQLTFTSPAKTAGTYTIYAVNPDGGTAIYVPGVIYSTLPTWTTAAGSLGSYYETTSISNTVVAAGDAPVTYSLYSGSLPTGSTLAANGVITGTAPVDSSSTTYSFTIQATDAQLQDSTRSFSLTINVDAVTWVSPANNTTYTSAANSAISTVTLSATDAAGYAVSYSANALPTGLSLSGANITGTPTVIADSSTLLTATAATTNRTAVRTINWSITVANDPYFEYNTLLIPGASTTFVDDASTNNFAVTIAGDTKPNSFNPYTPGYYSNYFAGGASDYLTASAASSQLNLPGDFTVECWVYDTGSGGLGQFAWSTTGGFACGINAVDGNSTRKLDWRATGSAPVWGVTGIIQNTWNHVAYVRSGSAFRMFLNGKLEYYNANLTTSYSSTSTNIGSANNGDAGYSFKGYISNFRVVKGTAVYTTASTTIGATIFTPSTTPLTAIANTALLTCQNNRYIDTSTNALAITANGNTTVNSFQPFTPNSSYSTYGSGYFDGSGDYLNLNGQSAFAFGSSASFTIQFWFYATAISADVVFYDGRPTTTQGLYPTIYLNGTTKVISYVTNSTEVITGTTTIVVNQWYYVTLSRNSGSTRLFVNGVQQGSTYADTINYANPASRPTIMQSGYASNGYLTGYVTDFQVLNGTGYSSVTVPTTPQTAIANTSLLILQNNQSVNNNVFLDNSSNNFLVTRAGNTTQGTFSPYGGNWSNYFDGSGDYLSVDDNSAFALSNSNFTLEAWIYPTATGNYPTIAAQYGTANNSSFFWSLGPSASPTAVYAFFYISGNNFTLQASNAVVLNTWSHHAIVRNSGTLTYYINGVSVATTSIGSATIIDSTRLFTIGNSGDTTYTAYPFTGYISNFRLINGTALYTTAFTPPSAPLTAIANTSLLTCQSPRFIDNSINNFTVTKAGDTSVQRFSPFNPSSVTATSYSGYFDGSGDYLTIPSNTAFNVFGGDMTIECWFYANSLANSPHIFAFVQDSTNRESIYFASSALTFWSSNSSGNGARIATSALSLNTWYHMALVKSGSTFTLYLNGTSVGTSTTTQYSTSDQSLQIGTYNSGSYAGDNFNGYISNVRVVKGTAVYTSNFTPSTSPLTAIANTSLLTLQSPTFIDNSTNNFTITAAGNSQPTIQNPFGFTSATTNGYTVSTIGGSGYFDGTGDFLTTGTTASNFLCTGSATGITATFEAWVYPTLYNTGGQPWMFASVKAKGVTYSNFGVRNGAVRFYWYDGAAKNVDSASTSDVPLNTWTHICVTINGSTIKIYINGVLNTTSATYTGVQAAGLNSTEYIGQEGNLIYFYGYISDFRLTNTVVYTSAFVPPSAPLTAVQNSSLLLNMTGAGVYDAAMQNNLETVGDARLSTAVSKFGGSSMYFDGSGDYLKPNVATPDLYAFGSGDFTIEFWGYILQTTPEQMFIDWRPAGTQTTQPLIYVTSAGVLAYYVNAANRITGATLSTSTWYHIAVSRSGTSTKMFLNGTQTGSTWTDTTVYTNVAGRPVISLDGNTTNSGYLNGYIDDLRVTKGYARYTSNFTAPTSAFPIY